MCRINDPEEDMNVKTRDIIKDWEYITHKELYYQNEYDDYVHGKRKEIPEPARTFYIWYSERCKLFIITIIKYVPITNFGYNDLSELLVANKLMEEK